MNDFWAQSVGHGWSFVTVNLTQSLKGRCAVPDYYHSPDLVVHDFLGEKQVKSGCGTSLWQSWLKEKGIRMDIEKVLMMVYYYTFRSYTLGWL